MKSISLCVILWLVTVSQMVAQPKFDKAEVKSWMKRVADWQIANPNKEAEHDDADKDQNGRNGLSDRCFIYFHLRIVLCFISLSLHDIDLQPVVQPRQGGHGNGFAGFDSRKNIHLAADLPADLHAAAFGPALLDDIDVSFG